MLTWNITDPIDWISNVDAAIADATSYNEYAAGQFRDPRRLKLRPDVKPTRFRLRPLTHRQRLTLADMDGEGTRAEYACRCALLDVRDLGHDLPPMERTGSDQASPLTSAWMERAQIPWPVLRIMLIAVEAISDVTAPLSARSDTAAGDTELPQKAPATSAA